MTTQAIITCVILVITMVLLISQKVPLVILGAAIPAALAATGVINAGSAYTEFGNTTIVFFMGLVVVGEAFFKTGLADFIGGKIIGLLGAITFLMLLTTQFLMNSSATVLVLPIAIMLCQAAGINPLAGAMSVSVCASGAFVTPFGTAPNLLVWEAGGYSVKDYLKCGFPMLIIFGVVTTALCAVFYL